MKEKAKSEPKADPAEIRAQQVKILEETIHDLGIKVENLSIDVNEDVVTVYGQAESQSEKEKVILALGNIEGIATVDDRISVVKKEPEAKFYEVQSGDSLSKIAKEFYGDAMKYNVIFEANQPMLKDPNKIYPGQMLRIPPLS